MIVLQGAKMTGRVFWNASWKMPLGNFATSHYWLQHYCKSFMCHWTVALPSGGIQMCPHSCATRMAALTCRLQSNPLMGLQHSTHFSNRQTHGDAEIRHKRQRVTVKFMCEPFPPAAVQFVIKGEADISCRKTSEATQQNHYFHLCFKCVGKKINASPKPYYLPRPWVTFFLSLFPYPPHPLPFTPIQQPSTPADGWGSTTADHGGGTPGEQTQAPWAASVYEWVTITPSPPHPRHLQLTEEGAQSHQKE